MCCSLLGQDTTLLDGGFPTPDTAKTVVVLMIDKVLIDNLVVLLTNFDGGGVRHDNGDNDDQEGSSFCTPQSKTEVR